MMSERRYDVMSFGEAMIRFTALNHMRLYQTDDLKMAVSAAELSVALIRLCLVENGMDF